MKLPPLEPSFDSRDLDLRINGKRVVLSQISVTWASATLSSKGFTHDDLLLVARSISRSECSHSSVKILLLEPLSMCKIYSNGKILVMGALTESQAYRNIAKIAHKVRYRTRWEVVFPKKELIGVNGLKWKYSIDENILKVKETIKTFKIDHLFCKVVLEGELDLESLYDRGKRTTDKIMMLPSGSLRVQVDLPEAEEPEIESQPIEGSYWDAELEIERELEAELEKISQRKNRASTCIIYRSGKINILGCTSREQVEFAFQQLLKILWQKHLPEERAT